MGALSDKMGKRKAFITLAISPGYRNRLFGSSRLKAQAGFSTP
jgi:hypothetical protein